MNRSALLIVSCGLPWSVACGTDDKSHPPFCNTPECVPTVGTRIGGSSGGAGNDASNTGQAGSGIGTVSVQGQIVEVADPNFVISTSNALGGTFTLRASAADGSAFDTTVGSAFTLDGLRKSRAAWILAVPASGSDVYPGVVAFDATTGASPVLVPLVRRSSLDLVSLVLTNVTTLDPQKAQVVLRVVDTSGAPIAGVSVTMQGAERLAYDIGTGYSDDVTKTGALGLAFLLNVDAAATLSARTISLSGAATREVSVVVQAGVATAVEQMLTRN